jgi:hypothetical protein
MEEPLRSTNCPGKYSFRQYLVDVPDPELKPVLQVIRHQNCPLRSSGFMDQRSNVLYLNRKSLTAEVTHDDLVATLGEEAMT